MDKPTLYATALITLLQLLVAAYKKIKGMIN
jgi:hypothetical protein